MSFSLGTALIAVKLPLVPPSPLQPPGAAVSVMSSGKPHQSQDLQT